MAAPHVVLLVPALVPLAWRCRDEPVQNGTVRTPARLSGPFLRARFHQVLAFYTFLVPFGVPIITHMSENA